VTRSDHSLSPDCPRGGGNSHTQRWRRDPFESRQWRQRVFSSQAVADGLRSGQSSRDRRSRPCVLMIGICQSGMSSTSGRGDTRSAASWAFDIIVARHSFAFLSPLGASDYARRRIGHCRFSCNGIRVCGSLKRRVGNGPLLKSSRSCISCPERGIIGLGRWLR
jgi:hypothetical protein